jgi:hypothetical protein
MAYILNSHVVPSIHFFVRRHVDIHVGQDICTFQENACRWLSFLTSQVYLYINTHTYYTYKIYCLPTRQVLTNLQTFLKALAELGCEQFLVSDLQGSQYFRGRVPRCDTSPHKFALKLIVKAYESYKYVMLVHFLIPQTVWPH